MARTRRMLVMMLALAVLAGCSTPATQDTITQVSTIDALLAGAYDGHLTCGALVEHGDLGLGTFDRLDGEMVLADGVVYQVKADGKVYTPPPTLTTPFAAAVHFRPDAVFPLDQTRTLAQFKQEIDKRCPNRNVFYAIRARGTFSFMKTRSVPAQKRPYPPLVEVTRTQPVFEMKDVTGTIVGFRCPPCVNRINVVGYHLHFLKDDLSAGGHVLDFVMAKARVEVDVCHRFVMLLPRDEAAMQNLDLTRDRGAELKKVEQ